MKSKTVRSLMLATIASLMLVVPAQSAIAEPDQVDLGGTSKTYSLANGETAQVGVSVTSNNSVGKRDFVRVTIGIDYLNDGPACDGNQPRSCTEANTDKDYRLFQSRPEGGFTVVRIPGSRLNAATGDFPVLKSLSGSKTFLVQNLEDLGFDLDRPIVVDVETFAFVSRDGSGAVVATPNPRNNQGILRYAFTIPPIG